MLEHTGDLWETIADARCITTNGIVRSNGCLVMGAGIALQAARRYPKIAYELGKLVKIYGNKPYYLPDFGIISFPTKHDWRNKSDLRLIVASAHSLVEIVDTHNLKTVVMPPPGCGLGGLLWKDVRAVLGTILDDRFTVLT